MKNASGDQLLFKYSIQVFLNVCLYYTTWGRGSIMILKLNQELFQKLQSTERNIKKNLQ